MKIDLKNGLSNELILSSRDQFGKNELPKKDKLSAFKILLAQFQSPLVYILLFAAVLTLVIELQHVDNIFQIPEFFAIIAVVVVNSLLGFIQEYKAQDTLEKLKQSLKSTCIVVRNGEEIEIEIGEVVVGDVVKLKFGDKIPADGIVIESNNLSMNEASITGETMPVYKNSFTDFEDIFPVEIDKEDQLVKKGTNVLSGLGKFIVTKVGINTQFGQIALKVTDRKETLTPLQQKLTALSKQLSLIAIIASVIIFIFGFLNNIPLNEIFEISVSLAVSSVPEALVISITVVLTVGLSRLLKKKALVRKLIIAETLGSVSTICVDKTGTLTKGIMKVEEIISDDETTLKQALHNNNNNLNSVDKAVSEWLEEIKFEAKNESIIDLLPFDSKYKFSISITDENLYFVGAPDILLHRTNIDEYKKNTVLQTIEQKTAEGKRLIAVCSKKNIDTKKASTTLLKNLDWKGLIVIEDPLRPEVTQVINQTIDAGVDVKIITGDFKNTALNVLHQIGIDLKESQIISGQDLTSIDDIELSKKIKDIRLFYRTTPDQKLRIVEILQSIGESVAMMGDGINDAPALKKANVGIVVDNATEVSKETADIVLLDSNFNTIIAAIEEGRSIFNNIKKILTFILIGTFDEIILIGGSIFFGFQAALLPLQILYTNIIVDGLPDLALSFEPNEKSIMNKESKSYSKNLFDKEMIMLIATVGIVLSAFQLGTYFILNNNGYPIERTRTILFMMITITSSIYIYSMKSLKQNIWSYNIFNNQLLNVSILISFVMIIFAFIIPGVKNLLELETPNFTEVSYVIFVCIFLSALVEFIKYLFNHKILKNN